jgi:hypothetical protein
MAIILAWLESKLAVIRWIVLLLGLTVTFWAGLHWANLACEAGKSQSLSLATKSLAKSQKRSDDAGASLEKNKSNFENKTKGITDAPIDPKCVFTLDRVFPISSINDAGKASRELTD